MEYKVWLREFSFMHIRSAGVHSECSVCIRHRAMIRQLGAHAKARAEQLRLYHNHLLAQYQDRCQYWHNRGLSRLPGSSTICLIQDGMDQNKFLLPRHEAFRGKDFTAFLRPKIHCQLTLVHGHLLLFTLSNPDCPKDSNSSVEALARTFQLLHQQGRSLRQCHIHIEADNTSREIKNNHTCRFLSAQISSGNLRSSELDFLRSGHSHEDVDQIFGRLSRHLLKIKCAQDPEDFRLAVESFCKTLKRPHEPFHFVEQMDITRDWKGWHSSAVPVQLKGIGGPGAPHCFLFQRREDVAVATADISNRVWGYEPHPKDIILRCLHATTTTYFYCMLEFRLRTTHLIFAMLPNEFLSGPNDGLLTGSSVARSSFSHEWWLWIGCHLGFLEDRICS